MTKNKISDYGEKKLIEQFIKPLFNPKNDVKGIGDDCAMIECNSNETLLLSTDRVPADLISFKLGLIDYYGLGKYLAQLNISDIAASGGKPIGLLLNFGLPENLLIVDFKKLIEGINSVIVKYDCKILGGDISASSEISISATSVGITQKGKSLTRRNAEQDDYIFVSRPIGLTPTAFEYFCNLKAKGFFLKNSEEKILIKQFTDMYPLCKLGQKLSDSGYCTSCMDNTDGLGQSLFELSKLSNIAMQVDSEKIEINKLTQKISSQTDFETISFAFGAGADFSLVGTLSKKKSENEYLKMFKEISIIGRVVGGSGVQLIEGNKISELQFKGWDYFV